MGSNCITKKCDKINAHRRCDVDIPKGIGIILVV